MRGSGLVIVLLAVCLSLSSCSMGLFDLIFGEVEIKADVNMDLGESTLKRIDEVNRTLARGAEIGPETRNLIREINKTIGDGIGLNDATLQHIDSLLRAIEDDLEIGLDEKTLKVIDGLTETIDNQPGQWEDTFTEIIKQLEQSGGSLAGQMADEVQVLMEEARENAQELVQTSGEEFRCNVDFLGARIGESLSAKALIGKGLNRRLRAILFPDEEEEPAKPWVCQILPYSVELEPVGERLQAKETSVRISGYNFSSDNLPDVYLVDDPGNRVSGGPALFAHLTSGYLITLNLQDKDFQGVPVGSYIRLEWTESAATFDQLIEAEEQVAYLEVLENTGVYEGPDMGYAYLGSAEKGAQYEVLGRNADSSWWQIAYGHEKGWIEAKAAERNNVEVDVAQDVPVEPPHALFEYQATPQSLVAPVMVEFTDRSTGKGLDWEWDFGDGEESTLQNPVHRFALSGPYQVRLTVANEGGKDTSEATITVNKPSPVAQFEADFAEGYVPHEVQFTSTSTGEPEAYLWDFGDGSPLAKAQNPVHLYERAGTWRVSLTVSNAQGQDTEIKADFITVRARAPVADFRFEPSNPEIGAWVEFTNESTDSSSSFWQFGDTELGYQEHARHQYDWAGTYEVKLTASNNSGSSSTKSGMIQVTRPDCVEEWMSPNYFSEEPPSEDTCPADYVLKGIKCEGAYCDNKWLRCCRYGYGNDRSERYWTPYWVSEETGPYFERDRWVTGLRCRGKYCDDLKIQMLKTPRLGNGGEIGGWQVSEETDGYVSCPANSYVCGIGCDHDYCDNVILHCCRAFD